MTYDILKTRNFLRALAEEHRKDKMRRAKQAATKLKKHQQKKEAKEEILKELQQAEKLYHKLKKEGKKYHAIGHKIHELKQKLA